MGAPGLDGSLPAELVERACRLAGVAGAVITLKEGLVVAAKVPPEMNSETLGAFLPQLFSRVEQSTTSMEIGALQSLQFTAGDRPWQIWKAGAVLFAVLGRPNELLPGAQLKIIAAQLARQSGPSS
jgi:predicted regulator of Ras-like GTPase activity (Roadblock/LC7/MglB family)